MDRASTDRILLGVSVSGFWLMSISFFLMPLQMLAFLPGILFWGGLLIGIVTQVILETRRRAFYTALGVKRDSMKKEKIGLLTFGANQASKIVDIIFLVSVVATILSVIFTKGAGYICYVLIGIMVFFFCAHCILNGRIYFYAKNQK